MDLTGKLPEFTAAIINLSWPCLKKALETHPGARQDFMLENGALLRSWATQALGPSKSSESEKLIEELRDILGIDMPVTQKRKCVDAGMPADVGEAPDTSQNAGTKDPPKKRRRVKKSTVKTRSRYSREKGQIFLQHGAKFVRDYEGSSAAKFSKADMPDINNIAEARTAWNWLQQNGGKCVLVSFVKKFLETDPE